MKKDIRSMGIKEYLEKTYEEKIAKRGSTPLHIAVRMGDLVIVKYLVKEGADVNAEDDNGYTPLFYACDLETTKYLLKKGADLNVRADNGTTVSTMLFKSPEISINKRVFICLDRQYFRFAISCKKIFWFR